MPDGLELAEPVMEGCEQPPDLADGELASCTVEWRMPLTVAGIETGVADLRVRLLLGDPDPRRGVDSIELELELALPTGTVGTAKSHGWMEDALLDLQGQLAEGVSLRACITCAFSDYSPAGAGLFGTMACFRGSKDAYRAVRTKWDLFRLLPESSGWVQETFLCDQYGRRASNTGYRG